MRSGERASVRRHNGAYAGIVARFSAGKCVVLDGGVGTQVRDEVGRPGHPDERTWGSLALVDRPDAVLEVHRAYVAAGAHVISTNTWGLSAVTGRPLHASRRPGPPVHWLDIARQGLIVADQAAAESRGRCAVAFSLNAGIDSPEGAETIQLLARLFEERAPDLILVETLSVLSASLFDTVERLVGFGLPVWLSFRRAATVSAASMASTGAALRAISSDAPRDASRPPASLRCS
jgi:S-methylmethionine-dependent homocysteine/selenocysteine methylase